MFRRTSLSIEETPVVWNNNHSNNPMKDIRGAWRLGSLFYEHAIEGYSPLWTICDVDRTVGDVTYPSLKQIYMSYEHTPGSEYEFAIAEIGSWVHWERLIKSPLLRSTIQQWRDELEVKIRANAIKSIIKTSLGDSSASATAAKWLAEKGYSPKRGRPTKEEKAGHLKQEERIDKEIQDDMERIGLKAVK